MPAYETLYTVTPELLDALEAAVLSGSFDPDAFRETAIAQSAIIANPPAPAPEAK